MRSRKVAKPPAALDIDTSARACVPGASAELASALRAESPTVVEPLV